MNSILTVLNLKVKAVILLLLLSIVYGFWQHFFADILPIHECRKSDSLTQAIQYMRGTSFFEPKTNWIANTGNQNAAAEFPIIYYLIGQIWKLTGFHLWLAKLFAIGLLFTAILSLLPLLDWLYGNTRKTLLFIGFVFSFPVLVYYADTLLPNIFSFSFLLLAVGQLFNYLKREKRFAYFLFSCFLCLAVLLKITALIAVLAVYGAFVLHRLFNKQLRSSWRDKKVRFTMFSLLLTFLATYLWYRYAIAYNAQYGSTIFSTTIRPIWEVSAAERWRIVKLVTSEHSREIIPLVCWPIAFFFFVWLLWSKRVHTLLKLTLLSSLLGLTAYFILWFWVFEVHDYYFIELLFLPLLLFGAYLYYTPHWVVLSKWQKPIEIIIVSLVFFNTLSFTQVASGKQNVIVKNTPFVSAFIKGNWGWFYFNHQENLGQLQRQQKAIQQIVQPKDTLLCFSDPYANVHLTAIDRVGYTNYNLDRNIAFEPQLLVLIQKGASKLLVLKQDAQHPELQTFLKYPIYKKANVELYDLTPFRKKT